MSANPLQESRERERQSKFAPRRDLLFIVSRDALDHYEHLKQVFADDKSVTVAAGGNVRKHRALGMLNLTEPIDAHGFCSTTDCDGKAGPWPGDSPWTRPKPGLIHPPSKSRTR